MRKTIPFLLGAAVFAPLFLTTPAQAQTYHDIQQLEQRVQEAKERGNWSYAQQLQRELNVDRLAYQRRNGLGEVRTNGLGYNNRYYGNYYYPEGYNGSYYYPNQYCYYSYSHFLHIPPQPA